MIKPYSDKIIIYADENAMKQNDVTKKLLIQHCKNYPQLRVEDLFKYIFQSSFGCEHLVSNENAVLEYIKREYESVPKNESPKTEELDGNYSRVHLSCINAGLTAETLAKIFCLSAKKEENGIESLENKIEVLKELIDENALKINREEFYIMLDKWKSCNYPPIHHSEQFRITYRPAYRVIANRYADFIRLFTEIDKTISKGSAIISIEGGSASGKSTLSGILEEIYDCNVLHMDDFFLRPEQRTPERLNEVGGNIDKERFYEEVLTPLCKGEFVHYRKFNCQTQTLSEPITVYPKRLTVIEGVYSMHPEFSKYYDISVFLDIDRTLQKSRILARNSERFAKRFFEEWIPLENNYFSEAKIKDRAELILPVNQNCDEN